MDTLFEIRFAKGAVDDLGGLKAFERARVIDAIGAHLRTEPLKETRNRKQLAPGDVPPWEHEPPIWELRVGSYRVFYDVDEGSKRVSVRAVRFKGTKTTKEIL